SLDGAFFFFSSRRRHTRSTRDWSSDVCSSDLPRPGLLRREPEADPEGGGRRDLRGGQPGRAHGRQRGGHRQPGDQPEEPGLRPQDRKSTRLNSSHEWISYAVFCLKKKKINSST